MDEEELFGMLEDKNSNLDKMAEENKSSGNSTRPNLWEKTDFKLVRVDVEKLKKTGKSFGIFLSGRDSDVPAEAKEKIIKVARALILKGYSYRTSGGSQDTINAEIVAIENSNSEYYLPWKSYNKNVVKPVLRYPTELGYQYAFSNHKAFPKLPATVRAILASNVHVLLGKECTDPLDLIIVYSPKGDEVINKDTDYKQAGNTVFPIKIASSCNIPVFNIQKEDTVTRLVDYIKSQEK